MRTKLDNDEEFKMLEKVVKRYKFNLVDEDLEEMHRLQTSTKKLYLEEPSQMSSEDDDEDDKFDSEIQNLNGPVSPDGQVFSKFLSYSALLNFYLFTYKSDRR
jgi:hypothetical protein